VLPGGGRHRIAVSTHEVELLFDGVVDDIVELIDEQLEQMAAADGPPERPERILLVGGFSVSEYLQRRIAWFFGGQVMVTVPPNPAAAVLFGAVRYGCLPGVVTARRARYTYGYETMKSFRAGHDPDFKRIEAPDGDVLCEDRFEPFVQVGETVKADQVVRRETFAFDAQDKAIEVHFYRTLAVEPQYVDEDGCEHIGVLSIDLAAVAHLPLHQRSVLLKFHFGDTDVWVTGTNPHTGEAASTTLLFDETA